MRWVIQIEGSQGQMGHLIAWSPLRGLADFNVFIATIKHVYYGRRRAKAKAKAKAAPAVVAPAVVAPAMPVPFAPGPGAGVVRGPRPVAPAPLVPPPLRPPLVLGPRIDFTMIHCGTCGQVAGRVRKVAEGCPFRASRCACGPSAEYNIKLL